MGDTDEDEYLLNFVLEIDMRYHQIINKDMNHSLYGTANEQRAWETKRAAQSEDANISIWPSFRIYLRSDFSRPHDKVCLGVG